MVPMSHWSSTLRVAPYCGGIDAHKSSVMHACTSPLKAHNWIYCTHLIYFASVSVCMHITSGGSQQDLLHYSSSDPYLLTTIDI